jgi:site-specific DNA recombinase
MSGPVEPLRAVAYLRESTEDQADGYSLDAQRQGIRRLAQDRGYTLTVEYVDLHSGWRNSDKRPEFQRLMGDAAAGRFEAVIVFHSSRFARDQLLARRYKGLLRDNGIQLLSASQPNFGDDPSDPSVFLLEGFQEMFDEYHSVSQSFWTSAGLQEKARQGNLIGTLPWGLRRDPASGAVLLDEEPKPTLVRELFERYTRGNESDRSLAVWLNSQGARTAKGNPISKDTVREMLVNSAYAGFVGSRRDKHFAIKGNHPAIIDLALFEQVQEIRALRTTTLNPGRPSNGYALKKLASCERCGSRLHGTKGGGNNKRRYLCSGRKQGTGCDQPFADADALEEQLAAYVRQFNPSAAVRKAIIRRLKEQARTGQHEDGARRRTLETQLERTKELYLLGDLTRAQYDARKSLLETELATLEPPLILDITEAAAALTDFTRLWAELPDQAERNKILRVIFEQITVDNGQIISVTPRQGFLPYFQFGQEQPGGKARERRDSNPRPPA